MPVSSLERAAVVLAVAAAGALGCSASVAPADESLGASPSGIIGTQRSAAAYVDGNVLR